MSPIGDFGKHTRFTRAVKKLHSGYIIGIIEIRSMPGMLNDEGNKDTTPAISFLHAKLSTMVYFVPVPLLVIINEI